MDITDVGALIRRARRKKKLTQQTLADACGLSRATVSGLESGNIQELGFAHVATLTEFLGLDVSIQPKKQIAARDRSSSKVLERLRKRYLWWETPGSEPSDDRVIAQVMDIGTFDDVKLLEREMGQIRMRQVMLRTEPGWFSPPSWSFWRVILGLSGSIGRRPPKRSSVLQNDPQPKGTF